MSKVLASSGFYQNIRAVVEQSRRKTAAAVNFLMIETYWHIGKIIVEEEQQGSYRAAYGDQIDTETCSATFQRVRQRLQSSEPLADAAFFSDVPNSRRSAARIIMDTLPPAYASGERKHKSLLPRRSRRKPVEHAPTESPNQFLLFRTPAGQPRQSARHERFRQKRPTCSPGRCPNPPQNHAPPPRYRANPKFHQHFRRGCGLSNQSAIFPQQQQWHWHRHCHRIDVAANRRRRNDLRKRHNILRKPDPFGLFRLATAGRRRRRFHC